MTNDHPKLWRAETGIFLIAWFLLMVGGRSSLFRDPGTLWHVVVGQHILADRQLPHQDAFSFTFGGQPWIAQWWLGECALAVIHSLSGLDSILLATATGLACLFAWMAHRLIRQGVHPLIAALVIALAALASSYHFHPRPHVVTIVLLAWTFARLCDFEAGRIPLVKLFWLIPVFVVWTNVHGGMVGGVATLALAVVGWTLARLLGMDSPILSYRQFFTLTCLTLACALTALVNPYGLELPRVWFALLGSPVLPRLIEEHAPLMTGSGVRPCLPDHARGRITQALARHLADPAGLAGAGLDARSPRSLVCRDGGDCSCGPAPPGPLAGLVGATGQRDLPHSTFASNRLFRGDRLEAGAHPGRSRAGGRSFASGERSRSGPGPRLGAAGCRPLADRPVASAHTWGSPR